MTEATLSFRKYVKTLLHVIDLNGGHVSWPRNQPPIYQSAVLLHEVYSQCFSVIFAQDQLLIIDALTDTKKEQVLLNESVCPIYYRRKKGGGITHYLRKKLFWVSVILHKFATTKNVRCKLLSTMRLRPNCGHAPKIMWAENFSSRTHTITTIRFSPTSFSNRDFISYGIYLTFLWKECVKVI